MTVVGWVLAAAGAVTLAVLTRYEPLNGWGVAAGVLAFLALAVAAFILSGVNPHQN